MKKTPIWLWIILGILLIPALGMAGLLTFFGIKSYLNLSDAEFIVPDEIAVGEVSDEANCIKWLSERTFYYGGDDMVLTSIGKRGGERNFTDIVEGTFDTVDSQGKKTKHTFSCFKDLSGDKGLGANNGGLFVLIVDEKMVEQDISGEPRYLD